MKNFKIKLCFFCLLVASILVLIIIILLLPRKFDKNISYLDIVVSNSSVHIKKGEKFAIKYLPQKTKIEIVDNKVLIKEKTKDDIDIIVPDIKINQVYISLGEGLLDLDYLQTDFFDLSQGKDAKINQLFAYNKTDIYGCDNVDIKSSLINNLDLAVLDSQINISGIFKGRTEIKGGTGKLLINLEDNDYNYDLKNVNVPLIINKKRIIQDGTYFSGNKKIMIQDSYGQIEIQMKE